ncbi:MAG: class I SAM-dependent methyltransferase [Chloroflexi bacterium]|nr:class I SAM-dependent methyltransferase [Chloroflexota bacterium]
MSDRGGLSSGGAHIESPPVLNGVSGAEDWLWLHLRDLPAFRALLRAVESSFYADLPLERPILDLGCGDGHFGSVTFPRGLDVGFDPWLKPLREATRQRGHAYRMLSQADGSQMPFADHSFATVISNSVLEHIPDVMPVLREVTRVLQPGGRFYFCVPGPMFLPYLSVGRLLDQVGLRPLGDAYRRFFNRISRHHHCDGAEVWASRLTACGLVLDRAWTYFPRSAVAALEWGHYLGLPSAVSKALMGRWVLAPVRANLRLTELLVRPAFRRSLEANTDEGAYLFVVARRP